MANPTDHLATVRAALSSPIGGPCRCHLNGPGDFEVCHSCEGLANALRSAAPAIAALADECDRLADLFDRIDTAFDQLRPAMADPFVAFVCATMHAAKDPAAPAPALLSDVPMGGDA